MNFAAQGGEELQRLAVRLKVAGDVDLRKSLSKRMTAAVRPLVPEVRGAVLDTPAKGPKSTGLRAKIARGVQVKTSLSGRQVGVRLRVDPRALPGNARDLPRLLEGFGTWTHPVYGHDVKVTQAAHPYFNRTILPRLPRVQTEVAKVLDDVAHDAGFH